MILVSILIVCAMTGCMADSSGAKEVLQAQEQESGDYGNSDIETAKTRETQTEPAASDGESDTELESSASTKPDTEFETEINLESGMITEPDAEVTADYDGPVKVSDLDYDSFQSRMTDEEWDGFQQYIPVLKENTAFELGGNYEELNRDGKPVEKGEYTQFYRYTFQEAADEADFWEQVDSYWTECVAEYESKRRTD